MSNPEPSIRVKVDVTNPGQFFACCGLLELADRLWPGAEGWFEEREFCLVCDDSGITLNHLLHLLLEMPEFLPEVTKNSLLQGSKLKLLPFTITFPSKELKIDWWRDEMKPPGKKSRESCGSSAFKTWSGNQSPQQIIYDKLLPAIRNLMNSESCDWFSVRVPLSGRFGFDHSAAARSIDVGWSPDKHDTLVATSPVIEIFAMLGLQRFRPNQCGKRFHYEYRTWKIPTSPIVASAKLTGAIRDSISSTFVFGIKKRGDYKYFSKSTIRGLENE